MKNYLTTRKFFNIKNILLFLILNITLPFSEYSFSKEVKNKNDFHLTSNSIRGSDCVGEAITYKYKSYIEFIKKINSIEKYKNIKDEIKYSVLSPDFESAFMSTVGCSYEQIKLSINNEPNIFASKNNDPLNTRVSKIYKPIDENYPASISILKIKTIRKIKFNETPNSPENDETIEHDLLKIKITYKGINKTIYGVSFFNYDWMGDLPDWLAKELKNQREIEINKRFTPPEINAPAQ